MAGLRTFASLPLLDPRISEAAGPSHAAPSTKSSQDLHLVSTFHYGFRREAPWLTASPHFYPPATAEGPSPHPSNAPLTLATERFTQITLPLLSNLHASGVSSLPDLISVTPSFWDIMRSVLSDGEKLRQLEADGLATAEDRKALSPDAWAEISQERKEWLEGKFRMIIRTVLETWPGDRPRILWRAASSPLSCARC